jgi:hypothetical protein
LRQKNSSPLSAAINPDTVRMIERAGKSVVGDIGFHGPPDKAGSVKVGNA